HGLAEGVGLIGEPDVLRLGLCGGGDLVLSGSRGAGLLRLSGGRGVGDRSARGQGERGARSERGEGESVLHFRFSLLGGTSPGPVARGRGVAGGSDEVVVSGCHGGLLDHTGAREEGDRVATVETVLVIEVRVVIGREPLR